MPKEPTSCFPWASLLPRAATATAAKATTRRGEAIWGLAVCGLWLAACSSPAGPVCDETCAPPKLVAPAKASVVASTQPKVTLTLAPGADGAVLQFCRDRACEQLVAEVTVSGRSGAPNTPLPTGRLYWRAFSKKDGPTGKEATRGKTASPTRTLYVTGAGAGKTKAVFETLLDVNGDDLSDVVVGAPEANFGVGHAAVYLSQSGLGTVNSPVGLLSPLEMARFGTSMTMLGDTNGDGFGDVAISAPETAGVGAVLVYLGRPNGLSSAYDSRLPGTDWAGEHGRAVVGGLDLNGDGRPDLAIGAPGARDGAGRFQIYSRGTLGLSPSVSLTVEGAPGERLGATLANGFDLDADGYGDLIVGAPAANGGAGRVYVYFGSASGLEPSRVRALEPPEKGEGFGASLAGMANFRGNGVSTFAVGAPLAEGGAGKVYVYSGDAVAGVTAAPLATLRPGGAVKAAFGVSVAAANDVDGDGFDDLVVGGDFANGGDGRAYVCFGAEAAPGSRAIVLEGRGFGEHFGLSVSGPGDLDGDGLADVVVGAPQSMIDAGRVYVFHGRTNGTTSIPTILESRQPGSRFGYSVAR